MCVSESIPERFSVLLVGEIESWPRAVSNLLRDVPASPVCVEDGGAAVALCRGVRPGVIVIDLGVIGMDERLATCTRLRRDCGAHLIALGTADDAATFRGGAAPVADDLVVKPFSCRDIVRRIATIVERERGMPDRQETASLTVDIERREVRRGDRHIALSRTQFDILAALARNPGAVVTRGDITTAVWGPHWRGSANTIDVHIGQLRRRLGDNPAVPRIVVNVRGLGFRFEARS